MVKTTNPEIARRIRVFVSSLEGFISQGYFFLLGGNRSHERWSKEEQYAKVYELRDDLEQKGLVGRYKSIRGVTVCSYYEHGPLTRKTKTARLAFENLFEQPANRVF